MNYEIEEVNAEGFGAEAEMMIEVDEIRKKRAEFEQRLRETLNEMIEICNYTTCSECERLYPTLYTFCSAHMKDSPSLFNFDDCN